MLDSKQEGFVEDIGWRTTKLRDWQGNLIILPNSRLADAIVTDYEKPSKTMALLLIAASAMTATLIKSRMLRWRLPRTF